MITTLRNRLALAALAAALAAGLVSWFGSSDELPQASVQGDVERRAPAVATPAAASQLPETSQTTGSLDNAARLLELGVAGDLNVDAHTRSALDVLLATLGNPPTATQLQQLEESLRRAMPGEAATQAMALVRSYTAYTQAAAADAVVQKAPTSPEDLKALLDKTTALRREHFDAATVQALFGAEEAMSRHAMAVQAIEADTTLPAQDKTARIKALRDQLPPDAAALQPPSSLALNEMEDKITELKRQGAGDSQIAQVRQEYLGQEAAAAMGEMEAQRERWNARYQAYAQERKSLLGSGASVSPVEADALLRKHFSEQELPAARGYDRANNH